MCIRAISTRRCWTHHCRSTQTDAWTLPLVPLAIARGLPLLAICRGAQEANVALGGTLHQAVQQVPPFNDHRAPDGQPPEVQYADVHPVQVVAGGRLAAIAVGTLLPVAMHPAEILAAAVWFSAVTWLMYKTRNIWDCVAAHAVTNLLLGVWVVFSGEWHFL